MIWVAFVLNIGPEAGWFSYVPLSGPEFSPGKRTDIWAQMITFTEVAALAVAVELVATILKQRAPGMTLARMPLFVWAMLVPFHGDLRDAGGDAGVELPDRRPAGRHPFLQSGRGRRRAAVAAPVLVLRPSRGLHHLPARRSACRRQIVETFSRRPIFGYPAMVLALVATGFLAFGLWVHHMFATGLPRLGNSFLHRGQHDHRDPERRPDLLLDRDDLAADARASPRRCCT